MIWSEIDSFAESMSPEFSVDYSQRPKWTSNVQWKSLKRWKPPTEMQLTCKVCKKSRCRPRQPCMLLANHKAWKGPALMQTVTGVVADISPPSASSKRPNVTPAERSHLTV